LDVTAAGFELVELADGVSREQVVRQTDAPVCFSQDVT
jgi:acyl CoA:acetate/3-ketoacid CoA transferase beta subunit